MVVGELTGSALYVSFAGCEQVFCEALPGRPCRLHGSHVPLCVSNLAPQQHELGRQGALSGRCPPSLNLEHVLYMSMVHMSAVKADSALLPTE